MNSYNYVIVTNKRNILKLHEICFSALTRLKDLHLGETVQEIIFFYKVHRSLEPHEIYKYRSFLEKLEGIYTPGGVYTVSTDQSSNAMIAKLILVRYLEEYPQIVRTWYELVYTYEVNAHLAFLLAHKVNINSGQVTERASTHHFALNASHLTVENIKKFIKGERYATPKTYTETLSYCNVFDYMIDRQLGETSVDIDVPRYSSQEVSAYVLRVKDLEEIVCKA